MCMSTHIFSHEGWRMDVTCFKKLSSVICHSSWSLAEISRYMNALQSVHDLLKGNGRDEMHLLSSHRVAKPDFSSMKH